VLGAGQVTVEIGGQTLQHRQTHLMNKKEEKENRLEMIHNKKSKLSLQLH